MKTLLLQQVGVGLTGASLDVRAPSRASNTACDEGARWDQDACRRRCCVPRARLRKARRPCCQNFLRRLAALAGGHAAYRVHRRRSSQFRFTRCSGSISVREWRGTDCLTRCH